MSGRISLSLLIVCLVLVGCGSTESVSPTLVPTTQIASRTGLQVAIASSDLAVGRNRFTFGLLDNNHPYATNAAQTVFFDLNGKKAIPVQRTRAVFNHFSRGLLDNAENSAAIEIGGVFVTYPTFTKAGTWGVEVAVPFHGRTRSLAVQFHVQAHPVTPAVGSPAPRSNNPTIKQLPAARLDSGRPPDDMHNQSIAEAIARRKPLVVLFATAAFCTSRMCGPEIAVVQGLARHYRPRVSFVHVEVYKDANYAEGPAPAFKQWRLQSEPWVFVVDRDGIISAKFEGPTPSSEIEPAIQSALRG